VKRTRVLVALAVIVAALGVVAWKGLSGNLVYYQTPTELLSQGSAAVGERARLGGLVEEGSVHQEGSAVGFIVTDGTSRVTVVDASGVPSLFREGSGVVVEGAFAADGTFRADTVIVKHGDRYQPPKPGETPPPFQAGNSG
jgi:cytochrome c-type biogenesis protein CcmE